MVFKTPQRTLRIGVCEAGIYSFRFQVKWTYFPAPVYRDGKVKVKVKVKVKITL
jgi:hypothetical protein